MFPALITALFLGLRHGSDIDHVAAISDLSATERGGLRAFRLSTVYALGHAAVLVAFGVAAVSFGLVIPESVGGLIGRVIGFTLIALAIYVMIGFVRFGRTWQPRSRGSLIWHASHRRLHRRDIDHNASTVGALVIGMIHGIGAKTPTQLLLLPAAAEFGVRRGSRVRGRASTDEHGSRCHLRMGPHANQGIAHVQRAQHRSCRFLRRCGLGIRASLFGIGGLPDKGGVSLRGA